MRTILVSCTVPVTVRQNRPALDIIDASSFTSAFAMSTNLSYSWAKMSF
jgi:hypothetical protein